MFYIIYFIRRYNYEENEYGLDAVTQNHSQDDAAINLTYPSIISENNILIATSFDNFNDKAITNVSVNFSKVIIDESMYNNSIYSLEMEPYNVFLEYPRALLCFGAICFVFFAIVGVFGNFISILALSRCKRLRNATTAFIVNLCIADLLFCSFSMPLSALTFIEKKWLYGDVLCKLFPLVRYSNGAVSLFSVIAITLNRYILIVHPKVYPLVYTKRNMAIMISLIWFFSILFLLPPLLGVWGKLGYDPDVGTCTILTEDGKSPKMIIYIIAFGLPSIVFPICYIRIYFVVRKASKKTRRRDDRIVSSTISFSSRKRLFSKSYRHSEMRESYVRHRTKNELRVLRVMLVVFIFFIVCYFPVSFVKIFHKENKLHIFNVLGYLGVYFSNIVNPIIYIVMSREYRTAYKDLFCRSVAKSKTKMTLP